MSDSKIVRDKFLPWYKTYGYDNRSLGWGSPRSQEVRFEQFIRGFDLHQASVVDVGCGFGDFFPFALARGVEPRRYIGVDLLEEFVQEGKRRVLDQRCNFVTANFLECAAADLASDYAIACGALNTDFPHRDEFVGRFLNQMWNVSKRGFGFSMENPYGFKDRKEAINNDPAYWLDYVCKNFTHKVVLFSDYHDADFTICVYKE